MQTFIGRRNVDARWWLLPVLMAGGGKMMVVPGREVVVDPIRILLERPLNHVALVVEDEDDRLQTVASHRTNVGGRELV